MSPEHIDVTLARLPEELPKIDHPKCRSIAPVLARVGDKWSMLIVMILSGGPRRFNELKRLVEGVSQRMLTFNLRGLERDGLVKRTMYATIPPRVDYELTDLGKSLCPPVIALGEWASANIDAIEAARQAFDAREGEDDPLPFAALRP